MPYPVCTGDLRLWKTQNLFSVWSVWRFRAPYIHRTSEKLMGTMQTQVAFLSSNSASGDVQSIENTSRMHDIYRNFIEFSNPLHLTPGSLTVIAAKSKLWKQERLLCSFRHGCLLVPDIQDTFPYVCGASWWLCNRCIFHSIFYTHFMNDDMFSSYMFGFLKGGWY